MSAANRQPAESHDPTPTLAHASHGVRLELLRAGQMDATPLFLMTGPAGDAGEIAAVASAFVGPQSVYAVAPSLREAQQPAIDRVEQVAALMVKAISRARPSGPYRLGGLSSGALIALEVAQGLRAAGEDVEALFLIDPVYPERHSRWGGRLRAAGRRLSRQTARRDTDGIPGYRPRFFDGRLTLIVSSTDRRLGGDPIRLWRGRAAQLDVQRVDADLAAIARESASQIAEIIDHRLASLEKTWTGLRSIPGFERPMILTTVRWFSDARLAHALTDAGFSVSACRPRAHALEVVDGLTSDSRLSRMRPLRSLLKAIRQASPDIILPSDEQALVLLRRLHDRMRTADPQVAALIARSLGNSNDWSSISSRARLIGEAVSLGVSAPATTVIDNAGGLGAWAAEQSMPVVLKTDGSWGGRGVAVVRDPGDLQRVWSNIAKPPGLTRAVKRALFDSDDNSLSRSLRRIRPVVNAQQFVDGREAIATVACADGEVLAIVCLEVVRATEAKGPAAVVRVIDHPAMARAAEQIVRRFRLTGFCGLDFMLTSQGEAQLLELNPRVTPTCHLLVEGTYPRVRPITLFPADPVLSAEHRTEPSELDVPRRAPRLVRAGETMIARKHRPVSRLAARLTKKFSPFPLLS
jgi:hypothetical protein